MIGIREELLFFMLESVGPRSSSLRKNRQECQSDTSGSPGAVVLVSANPQLVRLGSGEDYVSTSSGTTFTWVFKFDVAAGQNSLYIWSSQSSALSADINGIQNDVSNIRKTTEPLNFIASYD